MNNPPGVFLTAEWRHLAMLNFEVDPAILAGWVPRGTEIDFWHGRTYLSIVAFRFLHTRVWHCGLPFHRHFDEVNLRFYVRRREGDVWKRGVVFIKEIVPRRLIAWAARRFYNENYVALPMRHRLLPEAGVVAYEWFCAGSWQGFEVLTDGTPEIPAAESEASFITEHYWGYARQPEGATKEYQVEHPPWHVWSARLLHWQCNIAEIYGPQLVPFLTAEPTSVFVAAGSAVVVRQGKHL